MATPGRSPLVTVLMPVYNGERYLREAVDSILAQTFADFELLIINDGSTDRSAAVIESYGDPRIRLLHNRGNTGLIATLNRGLREAAGAYIARMDSDDIAEPRRLETQVRFMNAHPDVGLCGTWFRFMGTDDIVGHPAGHDAIRIKLLSDTAFAHPTVMLRRSALQGMGYDPQYAHAEDYELWTRLAAVTATANIPEVLLQYRMHAAQVSSDRAGEQAAMTDRIRLLQLGALGINPSRREQRLHLALVTRKEPESRAAACVWLAKLLVANMLRGVYGRRIFANQLLEWLTDVCRPVRPLVAAAAALARRFTTRSGAAHGKR
jgi:glycosyltransferase involved in cell wall biosynthesis